MGSAVGTQRRLSPSAQPSSRCRSSAHDLDTARPGFARIRHTISAEVFQVTSLSGGIECVARACALTGATRLARLDVTRLENRQIVSTRQIVRRDIEQNRRGLHVSRPLSIRVRLEIRACALEEASRRACEIGRAKAIAPARARGRTRLRRRCDEACDVTPVREEVPSGLPHELIARAVAGRSGRGIRLVSRARAPPVAVLIDARDHDSTSTWIVAAGPHAAVRPIGVVRDADIALTTRVAIARRRRLTRATPSRSARRGMCRSARRTVPTRRVGLRARARARPRRRSVTACSGVTGPAGSRRVGVRARRAPGGR